MTKAIHNQFLEIASGLSPVLQDAINNAGPVVMKSRNRQPLPEVLCRAIAGQQLSVKASRTIWGRVVDSADETPLIAHIANATTETLRGCGLSNSKAKAMKAIAEVDAAGLLDVDQLRGLDHTTRSQRLTAIWGVGQWTADMMGISYFGDQDVWPESDITVGKTLERLTDRRRKVARTAAHFAPHRSYLALYMWRIADAAPTE